MDARHRIVFVYEGPRDAALEAGVMAQVPGSSILSATTAMQGTTEVTLALAGPPPPELVERLRGIPRILDAAPGSLGEGA